VNKRWFLYPIGISILLGVIIFDPLNFQQLFETPDVEPTCGGYSYLLGCRADEGDFLRQDEHGYLCRQALEREDVCDNEIYRDHYWYKPMCDQYAENLGNQTVGKAQGGFVQPGWIMDNEGSKDITIPPRRWMVFQKPMTVGYKITLNWFTEGIDLVFWIVTPQWTEHIPPEQEFIAYAAESSEMKHFDFKATSYGEWSFIFYNNYAVPTPLSLHYTIFREEYTSKMEDIQSESERSGYVFHPNDFLYASVVFGGLGFILTRRYIINRNTPRKKKEKYHARHNK
jgi:hypothetical protein